VTSLCSRTSLVRCPALVTRRRAVHTVPSTVSFNVTYRGETDDDDDDNDNNKALVDSKLRPRCATHDKYYSLVSSVDKNLVRFSAVMLV